MLQILYEDRDIIVLIKPAGTESQSASRFAPDMVSEIKKHLVINKLCTPGKEPYVAVIHRTSRFPALWSMEKRKKLLLF